jgi:hypothetical protein
MMRFLLPIAEAADGARRSPSRAFTANTTDRLAVLLPYRIGLEVTCSIVETMELKMELIEAIEIAPRVQRNLVLY